MTILLTPKETAKEIGASVPTVYRLIDEGVFPVVRLPHVRGVRIRRDDLDEVTKQYREERD